MGTPRSNRTLATLVTATLLLVSFAPAASAFHDILDAQPAGHHAVSYANATYQSAVNVPTAGTYEEGGTTPTWDDQTEGTLTHLAGDEGGDAYYVTILAVDETMFIFYAYYGEDTPFYSEFTNPLRYTFQNATAYLGGEGGMQVLGYTVVLGPLRGVPHPCQVEEAPGEACVTPDDVFEAGHGAVDLLP